MDIAEKVRQRISERFRDSELRQVVASEMQSFLDDRPADLPIEEYCATVAFLMVRELSCSAMARREASGAAASETGPHTLDFETILNGLTAAMQYDIVGSNMQMVKALGSSIAVRDTGTNEHSHRVNLYAVRLSQEIGMRPSDIQSIIKGSYLHDIGKIGIPDDTLLKTGSLTEAEYKIMKSHPVRGGEIIRGVLWLEDARDIVVHHHEWYDGTGYPEALAADGIPINARIFAIADVFDALTSVRPYKEAYSYDKTVEMMKEQSASHFDPVLLESFLGISKKLYSEVCAAHSGRLEDLLIDDLHRYFGLNPQGQYIEGMREQQD